jgi:hypothetical protein
MSQWKTNVKIPGVPDEHQQFAREEQLKHRRASERLDRDCRIACQPQVDVPFSSAMDALERLLPFHVRPPPPFLVPTTDRVRLARVDWGLA